jgi:DMSO reductase anchor subunit
MHPALSVIFFTTLSGAGYGLLFWAAIGALFDQVSPPTLVLAIVLAIVLSTIGLVSSLLHLGKPARAWRAFSQWRTSWLSREGVASMVTFGVAVVLGLALLVRVSVIDDEGRYPPPTLVGDLAALAAMLCALATVYCTAMIYASLKPIPAWRHASVPWVYLLFSLFTGGLLLCVVAGTMYTRLPATLGVVLAIALWIVKARYWRAIDAPLPATRGDAIGLPQRTATVFERPHTEANYLTKEMGFVVARKHSRALRFLAMVLFGPLTILLLVLAVLAGQDSGPWYVAAALSALAGAFVERWLFFAEAKHMVTLYY